MILDVAAGVVLGGLILLFLPLIFMIAFRSLTLVARLLAWPIAILGAAALAYIVAVWLPETFPQTKQIPALAWMFLACLMLLGGCRLWSWLLSKRQTL